MTQSMKFMVALVRPHKLDEVVAALQREGLQGLVVTETMDYSQQGPTEIYRGATYTPKFRAMFRIEGTLGDHQIEGITEIIVAAAETGEAGDGRILIFDLAHDMPIRIGRPSAGAPRRAA
jgi:nitrogen regulatory protein PII